MGAEEAAGSPVAHRVVWQVADGDLDTFDRVLRNVANVLAELGAEGVAIEVVAHGEGLPLVVTGTPGTEPVGDLTEQGVTFVACENTMTRKHIGRGDLRSGVGTVASGIAAVVRRQEQGWSYLRG